ISSEAPNLQNVPVRTSTGRELRKAFIANEGCGLLTADYSQIELRVMAHLADDPGLIEAFERGADIHTTTAARVFDVAEDKDHALTAGGLTSRMVLTVHDELVLEVPVEERERVTVVVRDTMEHVTDLRVPLVVDIGFGTTWADAK